MLTIYKFAVDLEPIAHQFTVCMPEGARVLSVQTQRGEPRMWALVDTAKRKIPRVFALFGTGHEIPASLAPRLQFVATFQVEDGEFVFHLFEVVA